MLYHFSDLPNEESIEPSYDAIRDVILGFGFDLEVINSIFAYDIFGMFTDVSSIFFQKEQTKVKTRYAQNIKSMLQCEYNSVYFVCRKPDGHVDGINHNRNGDDINSAREQEN